MAKLPRGISKDPKQSGYHTYVDIGVNPTTGKRQRKHVNGGDLHFDSGVPIALADMREF